MFDYGIDIGARKIIIFWFAEDASIIGSHKENIVQNEAKAIRLAVNDYRTKVKDYY